MAARADLAIDEASIAIVGVLDFDSVVELNAEGQRWLQDIAPAQCRLDLARVTYSSSAGVALVLGWLRTAARAKKNLEIINMPSDMAALVRVSGLDDLLRSA